MTETISINLADLIMGGILLYTLVFYAVLLIFQLVDNVFDRYKESIFTFFYKLFWDK